MRRLTSLLLLLLIACKAASPTTLAQPTPPVSPALLATETSSQIKPFEQTPTVFAPREYSTAPSTPLPALPESAPTGTPPSPSQFQVRLHPDGPLYVGDLVSLEVIPDPGVDWDNRGIRVQIPSAEGLRTEQSDFGYYGIGSRPQATLEWAWDTAGLPAGEHTLTFSLQPDGDTWSETVQLLPQAAVPFPEPQAHWAKAESDCCLVYYITGTPAERDLPALLDLLDAQAEDVSQRLETSLEEPLQITFLPRVLGHGGFAGNGISVSYLDRNYAGGSLGVVLHHEMVHELDFRLGADMRYSMFTEGFAVYLTGGHFKIEPLMPRAAALLPPAPGCIPASQQLAEPNSAASAPTCGLDHYIPIPTLLDNFYFSQHEIGYLEAGALIEYMVKTWGWQAFSEFYRNIHALPESDEDQFENPAEREVSAALLENFGLPLDQFEKRFLKALQAETLTPELAEDVRLTVAYYDSMRRYQQVLDPSAYFLYAWLPDSEEMQERGIVADLLRRPVQPQNLALETMLVTAGADLQDGNLLELDRTLQAVNAVLSVIEANQAQPFSVHPLAVDYWALVQALLSQGYQPQRIELHGDQARAWVSKSGVELTVLALVRDQQTWALAE
ncbi:MAG: hypothetical protein AB1894_02445 [Chloroflexota bacterium]